MSRHRPLLAPIHEARPANSPPAFAQAAYCVRKLGIPEEKVNPLGGAIALGHPLAATGARQARGPTLAFQPTAVSGPVPLRRFGYRVRTCWLARARSAVAFSVRTSCASFCSQVATLLHELRRTGKRYGVVSMCIGTGMGAAAVFEAA